MARVERIARWCVIALVILTGVHGVLAERGLYADGAYDLYLVLQGQFLPNPTRMFALLVTQAPVWLAVTLGVTDIHVLAAMHSLGVVGIPAAIWATALILVARGRLFWPFALAYAIVFLNSGYITIGQYNLLYAYAALTVALLVRRRLGVVGAFGLLLLAVLMTRTYESIFYLGPCLAALAIVTWFRRRSMLPRWDAVVRWVAAGILLIGAVLGGLAVLLPNDPINRAVAADLVAGFGNDPQLMLSGALGVLFLLARWLLRGRISTIANAVLLAGSLALFLPMIWSQPYLHYGARTPTGLLLVVLIALALLPELRASSRSGEAQDPPAPIAAALRWVVPAVIVVALSIPFIGYSQGFRNWIAHFEVTLAETSGEVELYASPAFDGFPRYGWAWTNPTLSVLFRPAGSDALILSPGAPIGSEPMIDIPERFTP